MKIIWSPLALERVREITAFIAEESLDAARLLAFELFAAVERLERFPKSGRLVPEARRANIREIIHNKYRIIYRADQHQIVILTVRHSRQRLKPAELKSPKTKS